MEKCLADKQFLPISEINLVEPNKPQLATKIIIMLISERTNFSLSKMIKSGLKCHIRT